MARTTETTDTRHDHDTDTRHTTPTRDTRDSSPTRPDLRVEVPSNGHAIGSLVTGMLAVTLAFLVIGAPAAILLGIAAIILGAMGVKRAGDYGGLLKGTAISGIVSGVLGLLLGLAIVIGGVTLFNQVDTNALQDEVNQLQQQVDGDVLGG